MSKDTNERVDEESNAIIYEGASIRQLGLMFRADPKVVQRKLGGIVPCGRRHGTSIYNVKEAASRLVEPGYSIERYIMEMNHTDLPPLLSKEFWNSQRARLAFEEANADLWRTADVVRIVAELLTTYRFVAQTLPDTLEREAGLSREQKAIVRRVVDGALADSRDKVIARFKNDGRADEFSGALDLAGERMAGGGLMDLRVDPEDDGGTGVPASEEDAPEYNGL
jgi:hypothetical protein